MRNAHRWETPNLDLTRVSDGFLWAAQTLDGIMRASLWQLVLMEILSKPKHQQTPLLEEFSGPRFVIATLFKWTSWFCLKHVATSYH